MNKKLLLLTTTLILFAYIGKAYAEDLTVTCDNTSGCEMTPSPGDALFGAGESDNTNILPGYTSRRTIYLINDRAEMCNLILGNVTNVVLGPETPITFPYQLWTAMVEGGNVFYGGLFGGQADNTRSLGDLFDGGLLPITTIPAGGSRDVEWLVKFDPAAENEYQDAMTQFDFDMHFMCDDTREVFTVEKFTSAWPAGQLPGTTISYTITIHVLGDPIDDVIVTDLSPEFFAYLT